MPSIGGGYVWPPIRFASNGATITISTIPPKASKVAVIKFVNEIHDQSIEADAFERTIDMLLDNVVRMIRDKTASSRLSAMIDTLNAERRNPDVARNRKLEALLGFEMGEAPSEVLGELLNMSHRNGAMAIDEIAPVIGAVARDAIDSDCDPRQAILSRLSDFEASLAKAPGISTVANAEELKKRYRAVTKKLDEPYKKGYSAAQPSVSA
jgi:hypothetical protein